MPNLANGFLCFGPSFFVTAAFILSQIASKRCYFLDLDDTNPWRDEGILSIGFWCYTRTGHGDQWGYPSGWASDQNFNYARGFDIAATVLGAISFTFYVLAGCCPCDPIRWAGVGFLLLLTCMFEGLCFFLLRSETFCVGTDLGCTVGIGGNCAIAAAALWFVSAAMTCAIAKERKSFAEKEGDGEGG